jgi:sec-independent protein translocase protein TatC
MTGAAGEMPFLDHLEELRSRILRSLAAVVVGFGIGLWAVQQLQLVSVLKAPIAPYLLDGKLIVTSPTEPVMIVLKLGFLVGLVLASPVILWQLWAFLAPALYEREKRALVPSLFVGLILFLTGAVLAYHFVVPQALRVLFSFQSEAISPFITYDAWFGFVLQIVLALGISFELPLVMIILSWLGVIGPGELHRFRRYAVVCAFIAGAVLSPGADLLSMLMMTLPLIFLYEVGVAGSAIVHRRRRKAAARAALLLLGLGLGAAPAQAQEPRRTAADSARQAVDTSGGETLDDGFDGGARPGQSLDTATARRLGLPTSPSRSFAPPDSVVQELLTRPGYRPTRYRADSASVFVADQEVRLHGRALTERQGTLLEADSIGYRRDSCILDASGSPHLFDHGQVLVGEGISYDTCRRRGMIQDALTSFNEGSTVWFLRGNIAQDSSSSRIYAGSSDITSCDLPTPHYHFASRQMKWVSHSVLVARPVTLYVRDVPILWLPFIFQDMRPGRHSGILVPQFGINDLIRPTRGYNRQVTNLGYYCAPNDYLDFTGRLDWFANRYVQYGVTGQYRWLDRFVAGTVGFNEQRQVGGGSGLALRWDHRQTFDLSTSLNLNFNYASNTRVVRQNAIDPLQNTQQISSSLNFSKRYGWGTVTLGGNRRQDITNGNVQQLLPALTVSPVPLALGADITWSPGLSLTNNTTSNPNRDSLFQILPGGGVDTIALDAGTRVTALNFDTPLRFGPFNWQNSIQATDETSDGRDLVTFRVDDPSTPDPTDSIVVRRVFPGDFRSTLDWNTGLNLPILFRGSWKLQPSLGVSNTTSGAFALRNRNTGGAWVQQGKRFRIGASAAPTLFAFYPGIGPLQRIRHSFSPVISYNYEPAADVPEEYARAIAQPGQPVQLRSDARQALQVGLSQTFEGKRRPEGGDSSSATAPKLRLLSISTSPITYDFEQAKRPRRTGWVTDAISNTFLSDLVPGFTLTVGHDLWEGRVGTDTARFDPFLQRVDASFAISENTLRAVGSIFGLGGKRDGAASGRRDEDIPTYVAQSGRRARPGSFYNSSQAPLRPGGGRAFTASFNYSLNRTRPVPNQPTPAEAQSLGLNTSFSPTPFWSLSWSTQYNITQGTFQGQVIRLERDLHEWRAGFNFVKNPSGTFAIYFSIYLTDLPDLKFDYDQTTFEE